jgi:hypothetical protein
MLLTCDIETDIFLVILQYLKASVQISIELICLTLRGLFVRYISNLPSTSGFNMNYSVPRLPLDTNKLKCVLQYHVAAYERVEHEITLGRIAKSFRFRPISYYTTK